MQAFAYIDAFVQSIQGNQQNPPSSDFRLDIAIDPYNAHIPFFLNDHPICTFGPNGLPSLMMCLSVSISMSVMLVVQEHIFVSAICRKCNGGDAKAGEDIPESGPSRERSSISPLLAIHPSVNCRVFLLPFLPTHFLCQGSFLPWPAAATKSFVLKPVRLALGALRTL